MDFASFLAELRTFATTTTEASARLGLRQIGSGIALCSVTRLGGINTRLHGTTLMHMSNHQALQLKAAETLCAEHGDRLIASLRSAVPAFDHPDADVSVGIGHPGKKEPRLSVTICGMRIGESNGQALGTVVRKLDQIYAHIKDVPRPKDRFFEIHNNKIPAADVNAAFRVWAAFERPALFNAPLRPVSLPTVTEIMSENTVERAYAALRA